MNPKLGMNYWVPNPKFGPLISELFTYITNFV